MLVLLDCFFWIKHPNALQNLQTHSSQTMSRPLQSPDSGFSPNHSASPAALLTGFASYFTSMLAATVDCSMHCCWWVSKGYLCWQRILVTHLMDAFDDLQFSNSRSNPVSSKHLWKSFYLCQSPPRNYHRPRSQRLSCRWSLFHWPQSAHLQLHHCPIAVIVIFADGNSNILIDWHLTTSNTIIVNNQHNRYTRSRRSGRRRHCNFSI